MNSAQYQVIDTASMQVVAIFATGQQAMAYCQRKDAACGAARFTYRIVG